MKQHVLLLSFTSLLVWDAALANSENEEMSTILVTAPRSVQVFSALPEAAIVAALPGTTPVKLLSALPGASYTGSEDLGGYEWGNDISIRGFSAGQIGWMLDDIPLGSTHFWHNNGLDMHRAVSSENIRNLSLLTGGGLQKMASVSALGAGVSATTVSPARDSRLLARLTGGSHNTWRGFFRADTGTVQSGGRGYLSLSSQTSDKWKGMGAPGQQPFAIFNRDDGNAVTGAEGRWGSYHDQWNLKWVQPLGPHQLTFWADVSDKRENDYADLLLKDYWQYGRDLDNWTDWQDALSGDETVLFGSGASWRYDTLFAATLKLRMGEDAWLSVTPYRHDDKGNGDWHLPFITAGAVTDMKFRRSKLDLERQGVNLRMSRKLGGHDVNAGIWWETSRFDRRRYNYDLFDWTNAPDANLDSIDRVLMDRRYDINILQAHVQDRIVLPDIRWQLTLGAKSMRVVSDFQDRLGVYANNRLVTEGAFLPHAGLSFRPGDGDEMFLDYASHINAKPITVFTQSVFDNSFKAERSDSVELGWRRSGLEHRFGASVYNTYYRNRLLQIANCSLLGTCPSVLANVGAVVSRGVEAQWKWRLPSNWLWTGVVSYNDAHYRNDYVSNGVTVPTKGKRVVNAPEWLANGELRREWGDWYFAADFQHTGSRSASYSGDLKIPGFTLWGLSAGYETQGGLAGAARSGVSIQLRNMFDADYVATLGASGFYADDADGSSTYVQVGAPRGIYITVHAEY